MNIFKHMFKKVECIEISQVGYVLVTIIISVFPLILFRTIEILEFNGVVYVDDDLYYGSKALVISILALIIVFLLYLYYKQNGTFKVQSSITMLLLFAIWTFISATLSIDKMTSYFGWPFRWQGTFTYLTYFLLFIFVCTFIKKRMIRNQLHFLFVSALLVTFYGVMQYYDFELLKGVFIFPFKGDLIDGQIRSTIGNRNFFGSYTQMITLFIVFLYLKEPEKKKKQIYFSLSILFFAGVIASLTRGVWIGFGLSLIIGVILLWPRILQKRFKFSLLLIMFCIVFFVMNLNPTNNPSGRIKAGLDEVKLASSTGDVGQLGSSRMYIYKRTFEVFLQNPIFGVGPDCLGYHIPLTKEESLKYFGSENTICIDKAHSEYLEYAATMGLPGLVLYLTFISSIMIPAYKLRHKLDDTSAAIAVGILGYLIQAAFNIGVISVLPIFFILLAFLQIGINETKTAMEAEDATQSVK